MPDTDTTPSSPATARPWHRRPVVWVAAGVVVVAIAALGVFAFSPGRAAAGPSNVTISITCGDVDAGSARADVQITGLDDTTPGLTNGTYSAPAQLPFNYVATLSGSRTIGVAATDSYTSCQHLTGTIVVDGTTAASDTAEDGNLTLTATT